MLGPGALGMHELVRENMTGKGNLGKMEYCHFGWRQREKCMFPRQQVVDQFGLGAQEMGNVLLKSSSAHK